MLNDERAALEALMQSDPGIARMAEAGMQLQRGAASANAPAEGELVFHQAVPTGPAVPKQKALEFYSAASLYGVTIDRPPVIVGNLIPAGLTVLAGAPKRGKSWLALKMALCVASGEPFLGMPTQKGAVLYLDLESKNYRVQERLQKLMAGPAPQNLYFSHRAERLDGGLLEQLKSWASQVEHPSVIIIDTLGRIKGATRKGENAYESDTRIYGELQSFALENRLGIICVHHLKKDTGTNDDYFERISGSMGLTGACDAVMVLAGKRGEETSVLRTSSRDFEAQDFVLKFDGGLWTLVSCNSEAYLAERDYLQSPAVRGVIALAERYGQWQGTASEMLTEASQVCDAPLAMLKPAEFGRELNRFLVPLLQKNHIRITVRRVGKGRRRVLYLQKAGSGQTMMPGLTQNDAPVETASEDTELPW